MASIFTNALNYVQEREEPIDFLEILYDYEKSKDDLGISDDIYHYQQQKINNLSPMKQKNQNNSYMNNSQTNVSTGQDGLRSNSLYNNPQNNHIQNGGINSINNIKSIYNNNKQQKALKLSPIKIERVIQSPKSTESNSIIQTSQSQKNLKNNLGVINNVKRQEFGLDNQSIMSNQNKEHSRLQYITNKYNQDTTKYEASDIDQMYKSALFQNNLNRKRLQQIEFYPSQNQGSSKKHNNFFNTPHQSQQNQDNQESIYHNDFSNDLNNPYSLRNGNHILKEHFNLQISSIPDTRNKWVLKRVNKPINNHMANHEQRKDGKMFKYNLHSNNYDSQHLSTQADETNAFDSVQRSTQSLKEQILFQSLKPSQRGYTGTPLGQNFSLTTLSTGSNQFINLNNLMVSVNTPQFFFTQKQFFNQNSNLPRTAPSGLRETRKERGFQIKKFQINNGTAPNVNKPSTSSSSQNKIDSRQLYSRESYQKKKVKQDGQLKQNQFQDDYYNGMVSSKSKTNLLKLNGDNTNHLNSINIKTQNLFNSNQNGMNFNSQSPLIDNNSKSLPLFCLNFNKTLEKRLLLNSLGI